VVSFSSVENYRDNDTTRYDANIAIFDTIRYIVPTLESSQCQPLTAELCAPHHLCSVLHFRLLMSVYFLTVRGRSLSVSDWYWIGDSEVADFTGLVRSNFGWIVRPLMGTVSITEP